jgi:hypothetical protein
MAKKPRNKAEFFRVDRRNPNSNYTIGRYKKVGNRLYFMMYDQWVKSDCPLPDFKRGIEERNIFPE